MHEYSFEAEVWMANGEASWYFVSLPTKLSAEIKELFGSVARGWNSLPVEVI